MEGRRIYIEIFLKGLDFFQDICDKILNVLLKGVIVGEVVLGFGEGVYYVRQYEFFIEEYFGFKLFLGILNVKILFFKIVFDVVCNIRLVIIFGFVKDGWIFGDVKVYFVMIGGIKGVIVVFF